MNLKREHQVESAGVRARYVQSMKDIIAHHPKVNNRTKFARAVGTIPPTIHRWENNTGFPTLENVILLCKVFGVPPDYLLLGKGKDVLAGQIHNRISSLEQRMKRLEKGIKKRIKTKRPN